MGQTAEGSNSFSTLVLIHCHKSFSPPRHTRSSSFPFCRPNFAVSALLIFSKALYRNCPNPFKKKKSPVELFVLNYVYIV